MKRVRTVEQLAKLAEQRRSVAFANWGMDRPKPASFLLNMITSIVLRMIRQGLFEYKAQEKRSRA